MKAIILAAGLGTRLGDLTKASPKCLVKINGRSLLEWQLRALKKAGCSDIVLVIGTKGNCWTQHSHKIIKKLHDKILFNFRNTTSQNTFSLHLALNNGSIFPVVVANIGELIKYLGFLLKRSLMVSLIYVF